MNRVHLTLLALGLVLAAGMPLSASAAAHMDEAHAPPSAVGVHRATPPDEKPASLPGLFDGDSQVPEPLARPCEEITDIEVERSDRQNAPADDDWLMEPETSSRGCCGSGNLLAGRDAVAYHAARGPPFG